MAEKPTIPQARSTWFAGICALAGFLVLDHTSAEVIPTSLDDSHFRALRDHSPFSRPLLLSETLVLSGRAWIDGRTVVTLIDTEDALSYSVSEIPNDRGWKLIDLTATQDIDTCIATVAVDGGEVIRIRYHEERVKSASQRMYFEAKKRAQLAAVNARRRSNSGGHGIPKERVEMLRQIDRNDLPEGYNPGAGSSREDSHNRHQAYVDRRMEGMSQQQRSRVGQLWLQKQAVDPGMPNRGVSFVKILEHVAENTPRNLQ